MEIECHCQECFSISFSDKWTLERGTPVVNTILSGEFMSFECPNCKNQLKVELKLTLTLAPESLTWTFFPENERASGITFAEQLQDPSQRVLIGYKELREKVKIWTEKKDDKAIELLKYSFLKVNRNQGLQIYYQGENEGKLNFFVEGRGDKPESVSIPSAGYEKSVHTLETESSEDLEFLQGSHIQANSVSWED